MQSESALGILDLQWQRALLLDAQGKLIVADGEVVSPPAESLPAAASGQTFVPLYAGGNQVGTLVRRSAGTPLIFRIAALLLPVGFLSILLGILTMFIGMLLTRRVVTPLAEVIAASQAVAGGDMGARVRVQGPDDLRALTDSFNQMAGALEQSEAKRRGLLADIAHELRTPLTVIRGKLEGILDGVYPADEAHVAPVLEETYLLERLVDDLRLLTLAEGGQLHFDLKTVDLSELALQAVTLFDAQAAEKEITLNLDLSPGLPPVQADPQRTAQVIGNLMSNALRFTPHSGSVTLRLDTVQPSPLLPAAKTGPLSTPKLSVRLSVLDSGPGVPPEDLPHIFDRLWRGEKSRSRASGGSGLGLSIVRQLVEAQGGQVYAANRPEGGFEAGFIL
jgi:two-component system OmpR family sensor kinase/two-component system sensor histidine kinase BaeS